MPLGPAIRTRLGRLETPAAELYRRAFVNLDFLADRIAEHERPPARVLEIGCGDGAMADRLTARFLDAEYVGVDVAPAPGRRYRGDRGWAVFRTASSGDLAAEYPAAFDLVLLVDVIHHIASEEQRERVLDDARTLCAPDGTIVVKDWDAQPSLAHGLQVLADRYLSGDRTVRFGSLDYLLDLTTRALPDRRLAWLETVPPWRNNVALGLRTP